MTHTKKKHERGERSAAGVRRYLYAEEFYRNPRDFLPEDSQVRSAQREVYVVDDGLDDRGRRHSNSRLLGGGGFDNI